MGQGAEVTRKSDRVPPYSKGSYKSSISSYRKLLKYIFLNNRRSPLSLRDLLNLSLAKWAKINYVKQNLDRWEILTMDGGKLGNRKITKCMTLENGKFWSSWHHQSHCLQYEPQIPRFGDQLITIWPERINVSTYFRPSQMLK